MTRRERPGESHLAAAHVVFVLIAWPWADSRWQDHTRLSFLGVSANWTAPAAGLAAETPDDGKDLECASLPEAFGRAERARSEVMHPPSSYDDRRSFLLS